MLDILFFAGLGLYFTAMLLQFFGQVWQKDTVSTLSWRVFMAGFAAQTAYIVMRGLEAGRIPMANQFEFAVMFSWGIAVILVVLHYRLKLNWITTIAIIMTWGIYLYAALLPRQINDLMPALRSVWFVSHIGSAAFSYAAFMLAGASGIRYLLIHGKNPADERLEEIDYFIYRLIAIGLLLLTVTIVIGAIWAEEAWSSFWTWDPKEVWALITWILYAIGLHLRLGQKKKGVFMAWYAVIAVPVVLFTFIGVNTLMSGLHSYGAVAKMFI
ncbi:MAG: c-type cytochrome biogenesis protein CcsB [Solobacterium sp.]|nr:c-type cytochrome biogenesis protein CcsB [Solobacterium sp.]